MRALRRKPDGEGVRPDAGTDAKPELNRLRAVVAERQGAEKEVGRERARADAALAAAREALTARLAADEPSGAAQEALAEAQAAAAAPWDEQGEAARRKTQRAQADLEALARERGAALWGEYGARAVAAAEHVDSLFAEAREAIRALERLESEAGELLKLQHRTPRGLVPQRGLERLATDLKRRLEVPTPPPIPRDRAEEAVGRPLAWIEG